MAKYGDDWLEVSSKRSINPDANYVNNLHTKFWNDKFGSINGPDAYKKTKEFIENYNKTAESNIASIIQLPNGAVVVAVVDDFSKGSRQKKRSFYGQADRKGLPYWSGNTPLSGEVRQHIFRVCF